MLRSLPVIVAAIQFAAPNLSKSTATRYAKVIRREAVDRHFDPFTVVSMVTFESHWNAKIVNGSGCVGLGQICLSNYSVCQKAPDGKACRAKRAQLQNGEYNLRTVADLITRNRAFCRRKTGRPALFRYWLASYQGRNRPKLGHWCGQVQDPKGWRDVPQTRITRRVIRYRLKLIRRLKRR